MWCSVVRCGVVWCGERVVSVKGERCDDGGDLILTNQPVTHSLRKKKKEEKKNLH